MLICMRTTLNIPDELVLRAKQLALRDGRTLTDMLVSGLSGQIAQSGGSFELPVSAAGGGLLPGLSWERLLPDGAQPEDEWHR